MRRVSQGAALVCVLFALWVIAQASQLEYSTSIGPGAGFFPMWLGILFGGLSAIWFVQASTRPDEPLQEDFIPDRGGMFRIIAILLAIAAFTALVDFVGFQVTMFAFLLFLLLALGRQNPALTLVLSLLGSVGVYYVFVKWLDVPLPTSTIGLLSGLGL